MSDLTFDVLTCLFSLGMVAFVLLIGAATRTSAVVGVSIGLLILGTLVFGFWFGYRLDGANEPLQFERTAVRTLAGLAGVLLFLQGYVLIRVIRRRRFQYGAPSGPSETTGLSETAGPPSMDRYDRRWLLSLLQSGQSAAGVKIANPAAEPTTPAEPTRE